MGSIISKKYQGYRAGMFLSLTIIDRKAGEIIPLVESVHLSVHVSVCLFVGPHPGFAKYSKNPMKHKINPTYS